MADISKDQLDRMISALRLVMRVTGRKLMRVDFAGISFSTSPAHMGVLGILGEGDTTASALAKMLMVTKPQITHLVDQLVAAGCVERQPDSSDRRVSILTLTERGRGLLEEMGSKMRENVRQALAGLSPEELTQLTVSLESAKDIMARF